MKRPAGQSLLLAALVLAILALQARLWFGEGSLRHVASLRKQVAALQAENDTLADRNRLMNADVEDLKEGLDKIEEIARRDLGMIREGETFYLGPVNALSIGPVEAENAPIKARGERFGDPK